MIPNPWTRENLCPLQSSDGGVENQRHAMRGSATPKTGTDGQEGGPLGSAPQGHPEEHIAGVVSGPSEAILPPLPGLQISSAGDTLDEERFMADIEEPPAFIVAPSQGYLLSCEREQTTAILEFLTR
jgi:hypothetical protein